MVTEVRLTRLAGAEDSARLLVVGPSLGTAVSQLWQACVAELTGFEVIGWDLPGHGGAPRATGPFTVQDIADAVEAQAKDLARGRGTGYAGVSFGGAVGLELAARDDTVFDQVVCVAAAPTIGEPRMWHERAALVRKSGTAAVVEGASRRWFAPGFAEREPDTVDALFTALTEVDDESYAWACEALALFKAREVVRPVHAVAGEHDVVVPAEVMAQMNSTSYWVVERSGHLPPVENPQAVAQVLAGESVG
ncbi:alpha/beta fold hydrolase [Nocardia sp. NRRL S-836]|uniref:alpha/beta fold hydrolase n=1 Tax=Nocardia sp. NRRL S-836 TaxID=1519492 RepID=UPI0006C1BA0A|nr:alpha/beta fold hydrolase [Nocardia sp. NRRL S-836]KOV85579.1 hypothetical protein ADL03_14320 [Nocardia sp. NRRL S-836]